jgi:plasmid maintenance system antidote protein VapI
MATRGIRSNRELAKIMGVSETTVGRWVDGESCPTDERIDELAKIFDVQIHVLFTPHELTPLIN